MSTPHLPPQLVAIARQEIGVEEVGGTNCGPRVNQYKAATWLPADEAWPWCAAFVCWCVREALKATGVLETATFKRPQTAGAWDLENWSLAQDASTQTKGGRSGRAIEQDIQAGDIIIFTFSHVGIATGAPVKKGNVWYVPTVEGNTDDAGSREGGGVFAKLRKLNQIKTRIRLMV